ncbi:hypothetical protein ACHQM5_011242 [Ranunculus cassubicifolius]
MTSLLLIFILATAFWSYTKIKKGNQEMLKRKFFIRNGGLLLKKELASGDYGIKKVKIFCQEELKKATDNFSSRRILGRGGFGTVYKGMLHDGRIVAIKKSIHVDKNQTEQFINELVILSQINHKNVVRLFGCCLETAVPLLVYEYISNGTLSDHLHGLDHKSPLAWQTRLQISVEISAALAYLHSSTSIPIYHRDIKSSNILLDGNFKAKVSDFGLSRTVPFEKSHLTTAIQGTFGYLDPEYFHSGQFTEKSDVYGFGIILVELLTGRKPLFFSDSGNKNLSMHFISSMKDNCLFQVLDSVVQDEASQEEILALAKLAKKCIKPVGKKRPTMKEVTTELERLRRPPDLKENLQRG